jgi:hypothetical protein
MQGLHGLTDSHSNSVDVSWPYSSSSQLMRIHPRQIGLYYGSGITSLESTSPKYMPSPITPQLDTQGTDVDLQRLS